MIRSADHIIDLGIGAGIHGGSIVVQGDIKDICKSKIYNIAIFKEREKLL